ncbi:MAG: YafY family protein [Acidobacteriota bacterium]
MTYLAGILTAMRADRLISILLLLQAHRRLTSAELARQLDVSRRTIQRDMEALSMAGIPLYAERGQGGGWRLVDSYRAKLTGLKPAETRSLLLARSPQLLRDLGLGEAAESAVLKLLASLSPQERRDAEFARQRLLVDTGGWSRGQDDHSCLPTLQAALWQERRIRYRYRTAGGAAAWRDADPLGLVAKGGIWYLVATSTDTPPRTYRVSRISQVESLDALAERPADFDLAAYWKSSTAAFRRRLPRYDTELRVRAEALPWLEQAGRGWRLQGVREEEDWHCIRYRFDIEEEAVQTVLGLGLTVQVLAPAALREKVLERARAVVEAGAMPKAGAMPTERPPRQEDPS